MENAIYEVRKHQMVQVSSKAAAEKIIKAAKLEGFHFVYKKDLWLHLVIDADNMRGL